MICTCNVYLKKNKITLFFWGFQVYEFYAYIVSKELFEYKEWRGHFDQTSMK